MKQILAIVFFTLALGSSMSHPSRAEPVYRHAVFAGGCFWCMQPPFDKTPGVVKTEVGYTGGSSETATYEQVSAGDTGHLEAIDVLYDPNVVSYETLLDIYWKNIDPLDPNGQFCDKGDSYKSAIFYMTAEEKKAAEETRARVQEKLGMTVVTDIHSAMTFYPAEEYHQNYYKKNPIRYRYYRHGCGRDQRLRELWGE